MKKLSEIKEDIKAKLEDQKIRKIVVWSAFALSGVAIGVMVKKKLFSAESFTYSLGIDSPCKLELSEAAAEAYNRVQQAFIDADTARSATDNPYVFIGVKAPGGDAMVFNMIARQVNAYIKKHGPFQAPSDFLVKN